MNKHMKIGLALQGGGLQGFAHIGAIRALEELGINDIQYVSGTSTGSIVASLYAMGYNTYEMEKICEENYGKILRIRKRIIINIARNFMVSKQTNTEGLIDGKIIEDFINNQAIKKSVKNIKDIKNRELAITTVDTKSIKECIFTTEDRNGLNDDMIYITDAQIGQAVHASMAFPAIITPLNYKEYNFIDGGTVDNLPTKVLKNMGADKIIAIGFDVSKYNPSNNMEDIIFRALDIFSYENVKKSQEIADIAIEVYNSDASLLKVGNVQEAIKRGYDSVMANKNKIEEIILKHRDEY